MLEKKQILAWVQELGETIGKDTLGLLFQDDKVQGDKKIGHGQFRELAALCSAAECYEEIELLVKYNTAKAPEGKSWATQCGKVKFGDLIVQYMHTIRAAEQSKEGVMTDLMHFFGYLYWQSRVWSAENPAPQSNYGRQNGGNQQRNDQNRGQKPGGYGKQIPQHKGGRW